MADAPSPSASRTPREAGSVHAVVDDLPLDQRASVWQVGGDAAPRAPDPAAVRAARLEARLAVYARYAAVVAEEAGAVVAGHDDRRDALRAARDDAAEHFAELRDTPLTHAAGCPPPFADALTDALHELRHQDAVDRALARRLRAMHDVTALPTFTPALGAGPAPAPRVDVRF